MVEKIIFSPLAAKEIEESLNWYEGELAGLGKRFIEIVNKSLITISFNPETFPVRKHSLREMVIRDFPFIIVYEYFGSESVIYVLHIFHTSRNPKLKYRRK